MSCSITTHKSRPEDVSQGAYFNKKHYVEFINTIDHIFTMKIWAGEEQVGFGIVRGLVDSFVLEMLEIFPLHQGKEYASWFLNFLLSKGDFHFVSVNGSLPFYLKNGAVPIAVYKGDLILAFLNHKTAHEYHRDLFGDNEPFEFSDFVYNENE